MVRYLIFVLAIALCATVPAAAQSRSDESFENELSYGINFNSNGGLIGGVFLRSSYYKSDRLYQFWGVELVEVKHPKERQIYSVRSGETFIRGKQNYLFVVRPHYGGEYVLFKKAAESGVQVNAVGAAGPSFGLMVPYYVRYSVGNQGFDDIRTVRYDPNTLLLENIYGSSGVFTGLSETNVNMGVHFKAGVSFEYGRYHESITGIEVGFLVEHFFKRPVIIPEARNYNTFTSVYLNLYYGRRK